MDLWVQFPSVGIRGTSNKALIKGHIEGVEVRVHRLWDCQNQGEDPDECCSQDNACSGVRCLEI